MQQFVGAAAQAPAETLQQRTMSTRTLLPLCVCLALQPQTPRCSNRRRPRYAATQEPPPADKPVTTPPTPPPSKPVTGPWQWSPDQQKAETEVAAWRRSVTSADFDDALV